MTHEDEYHDNMVTMLELIWGKGYMAPGGPGNVAKLLNGMDTQDKRILDIGCGIGGPAFEMVNTHGANVVGIDLEAPLISRATQAASDLEARGKSLPDEFLTWIDADPEVEAGVYGTHHKASDVLLLLYSLRLDLGKATFQKVSFSIDDGYP